jgi:hypothetical protein
MDTSSLKTPPVRLIQLAGALCVVAILSYCVYTRSYEAASVVILLVFFAYFLNLKSLGWAGLRSPPPL